MVSNKLSSFLFVSNLAANQLAEFEDNNFGEDMENSKSCAKLFTFFEIKIFGMAPSPIK
jgi:hypothetical protein